MKAIVIILVLLLIALMKLRKDAEIVERRQNDVNFIQKNDQ